MKKQQPTPKKPKLKLKKETIRVLSSKEAKAVNGGGCVKASMAPPKE